MPKIEFGALEMQPVNVHPDDANLNDSESHNDGPRGEEAADSHGDDINGNRAIHKGSEIDEEVHVVSTNIVAITKSQLTSGSSPRFMFMVEIKWSDGRKSHILRDHDDIFRYHCWLLDTFQDEAGHTKSPRQIPLLPGKKFFRNDLRLAEERKPLLNAYLSNVIKLKRISESAQAQAFFKRRPRDPKENEPLLQNDDESIGSDSPNIREDSRLYVGEQQSKGCTNGVATGNKHKKDQINGSHDNKTFEGDEDDHIATEATPKRDKDGEIENSKNEQSALDTASTE